MNKLPADSRLAVGRSLGDAQCLAHLSLCQAERETTDLELLGKLSHLVEVDSIDHDIVPRITADSICIRSHTYIQLRFDWRSHPSYSTLGIYQYKYW